MAKLYPPMISGTIPAFCGTTKEMVVPFSMNRAVSKKEVAGFALKIKTVNGVYKGTVYTTDTKSTYDIESKMQVTFDLSDLAQTDDFFIPGQYYKVQLAYLDKYGSVGYYSTVGIVKCTIKPKVFIEGLTFGEINPHSYYYTGVYSQLDGDTTEKMYSSRFKVFDENNNLLADSGEILHNTSEDDLSYEQTETFQLTQDLDLDKSFYLLFSVTTTNNMNINTSKYRIMQRRSIEAEIKAELMAELDFDNGYVNLSLHDTEDDVVSGTFLISRAASNNGFAWEEFRRFDLQSMIPDKWGIVDCTVEQGITYRYSLQQYNENNVYSDRIVSQDVYADFEDAFLYDGERQLKIRFNPKVSTFKNDILETKTDTIGSKHPFITRNGHVNYKELAISGLISYQMDEAELFMDKEDLGVSENIYDLVSENITAERIFKIEVLSWLTDGKPKIFRSPSEGNFIVRLMNVSLSPNDTVGRMLHTFSATAYEIADFTTKNLEYYKLIDPTENLSIQTRWVTIKLDDLHYQEALTARADYGPGKYYVKNSATGQYTKCYDAEYSGVNTYYTRKYDTPEEAHKIIKLVSQPVYKVTFTDMEPGSIIYIGDVAHQEKIMIGATGAYMFDSPVPLSFIGIDSSYINSGLFTYSYQTKAVSVFGTITQTRVVDIPLYQIIGNPHNLRNILKTLGDVRTDILKYYFMRFWKRDTNYLFVKIDDKEFTPDYAGELYLDMDCTQPVDVNDLDELSIYHLRANRCDYRNYTNEGYYVNANNESFAPYLPYGIDGNNPTMGGAYSFFVWDDFVYQFYLNDELIDIAEKERYYLADPSNITSVYPGIGIITELSFTEQVKSFSFEEEDPSALHGAKRAYEVELEQYLEDRANLKIDFNSEGAPVPEYENVEITEKNKVRQAHTTYMIYLEDAINSYKEANGIT